MPETFCGIPQSSVETIGNGAITVLGAPFGVGYPGRRPHSTDSPQVIRRASQRIGRHAGNLDFTLGRPGTWDLTSIAVDLGDVPQTTPSLQHAETAARVSAIVARGGIPLTFGGDHSIPIGILRGFEVAEPFWIVQFDAHLDLRDEVDDEREGLSNSMRRAMELPWVAGTVQIGVRGVGSTRADDLTAVSSSKPCIQIPSREIRRRGFGAIGSAIPADIQRFYVTLDLDAFDPAIAPGVVAPAFGGMDYFSVLETLELLADRGSIIGMDIVELASDRDINDLTALLAARIAIDTMVLIESVQTKTARALPPAPSSGS